MSLCGFPPKDAVKASGWEGGVWERASVQSWSDRACSSGQRLLLEPVELCLVLVHVSHPFPWLLYDWEQELVPSGQY